VKKILAIAALIAVTQSAGAQTYACQFTDSAGFTDTGSWKISRFNLEKPFFLKFENGNTTAESAGIVLLSSGTQTECKADIATAPNFLRISTCSTIGAVLIWSPDSGNGSLARLYGGFQRSTDKVKDTVTVALFSCQRM